MVKRKFRKVGLNQNINPDLSVTFVEKLKGYGNMYNVFDEVNDFDLGNYSEGVLISRGFTKSQLDNVRKQGTTNFVGEKKPKNYTMKTGKFKKIDDDEWGRKRFKNPKTGQIIVDVDGLLFSTTRIGEPDCPLKNQNQ